MTLNDMITLKLIFIIIFVYTYDEYNRHNLNKINFEIARFFVYIERHRSKKSIYLFAISERCSTIWPRSADINV